LRVGVNHAGGVPCTGIGAVGSIATGHDADGGANRARANGSVLGPGRSGRHVGVEIHLEN